MTYPLEGELLVNDDIVQLIFLIARSTFVILPASRAIELSR